MTALTVAQTPPMGPVLQVNAYTTGNQAWSEVASDSAGNLVVVWISQDQNSFETGILGRRFDASGTPQGDDFQISTYMTGLQTYPDLSRNAAGNFVVAWMKGTRPNAEIVARLFDGSGNPLSGELGVSPAGIVPRVGVSAAGTFVVVWATYPPGDENLGIRARLYDANGSPRGGEFQVNTYTTGDQYQPSVAMSATGDFVVAWTDESLDGSSGGIFARRFDSSGVPQGTDFQVNTYTTGYQSRPALSVDGVGNLVIVWRGPRDGSSYGISAQRFDASGNKLGSQLQVNSYSTGSHWNPDVAVSASDGSFIVTWWEGSQANMLAQRFHADGTRRGAEFQLNSSYPQPQPPSVTADGAGRFAITWVGSDADGTGIVARLGGFPDAQPMGVDQRAVGGQPDSFAGFLSNQNGVLEAGERVAVDLTWANPSAADLFLSGSASNLTGPPGPAYTLQDASADYGTIPAGSSADCFTTTGNCYEVEVSGARPQAHWDATFDEALSTGVTKTWTLHVGESFPDVPTSNQFYGFIENIFHNGITSGCGSGNYCPNSSVTRAQMAVFLLKSKYGSTYVPPACGGVFPDVPCPSLFADWIEQLLAEGITSGCGGGNYCPNNPVTRAQMAVFLLKSEHGSAYTPLSCAGIFGDVTCPSLFADWIEQLAADNITGGCGGGNYCPNNPNTRGQMAVFLVKTFGLQLYGP